MSALITSVEHALTTAASDTVKVAKFVETSVLPVLKKAQADQSTIESITSLVSPQAANIERAGFAVLGVVINAIDVAGSAAGANGLNASLDAQLVDVALLHQLLGPPCGRLAPGEISHFTLPGTFTWFRCIMMEI